MSKLKNWICKKTWHKFKLCDFCHLSPSEKIKAVLPVISAVCAAAIMAEVLATMKDGRYLNKGRKKKNERKKIK
jgi:hypothetical protein